MSEQTPNVNTPSSLDTRVVDGETDHSAYFQHVADAESTNIE